MMTLRLDTAGLRTMIEENPTFKLDIQQAVVDNIRRDVIEESVRARIEAVLSDMAPRENYYTAKRVIKDKSLQEAISVAVRLEVKDSIAAAIEDAKLKMQQDFERRVWLEVGKVAKDAILASLTRDDIKAIMMEKLL